MKLMINRTNIKNCHRYSATDNGQLTTDKKNEGSNLERKSTQPIGQFIQSLVIIVIVSFNFLAAYAATPKRIALLPFKINSEKDLSFLKDGIFDMLSSRLSKEGQVEVLGRAPVEEAMQAEAPSGTINETAARSIGRRLNADYVLFGSLTVLGNNVSIDAKMADVTGGKPALTFFDQSQDLGAVITKIDLIAADINDKIFGRSQTKIAGQAPAPAATQQPSAKSDIYAHPEKILREDGFISHGKAEDVENLEATRGVARETQAQFWRSANFKTLINGIALGDVDGDGKIETVTITPHAVVIFRSEGGAFRKIAEIEESINKNLIGVDTADINENGYAEIFVTSLNADHKVVNSFILEYGGKDFAKIIDGSHYYYRVVDTPGRGKILLGQRPSTGKPSAGAIYEMKWQNGDYVPTEPIPAPRETNLMGVTVGDVLNNGMETTVAYQSEDHIKVINSSGDILWDNRERFGGSMLYASVPLDYRGQVQNKWYFPLRLVVWYDKARKESELIAVQNQDLTAAKLQQFRYFTKTYIAGFTWDGTGLAPSWKTRQFSGFIQDFIVGDFDNDGQDELVAALVIDEGRVSLVSEAKSAIIGYELTGPQQSESKE
jgi:TolB-like protein